MTAESESWRQVHTDDSVIRHGVFKSQLCVGVNLAEDDHAQRSLERRSMRAGHAAHVDNQAALQQARELRPPPNAARTAFAMATASSGSAGVLAGSPSAAGPGSLSVREEAGAVANGAQAAGSARGAELPCDHTAASSLGVGLSQLQQLAQSDPSRFRQAASAIAGQLRIIAASATGPNATAIAPMVASFHTAAATGVVPSLKELCGDGGVHATAGINPSVLRYAQGNSAAAAAFAQDTLRTALGGALSSPS